MKICFFLDDITKIGGIERVTSTLVKELSNYVDIEIVSIFRGKQHPHYPFNDNIKIHYLTNCEHGIKPHSIKRLINLISKIGLVKDFFAKHQYDIIIAQSFPPCIAMFFSNVPRSKIIAVEHVYAEYYGQFLQLIRNFMYRRFAKVVVLTKNDKCFFDKSLPSTKTVVIPNPIDKLNIYVSPLNNKRIISVGRLEYQKGYDNLISCFEQVHFHHPDWILDIYGDGSLRSKLQKQIDRMNLSDCVHLCGVSDKINDKFRESAFYVMSSHFEGFPMVLVEAMSQGLPCVSFNCPNGPSDIIAHGKNGLLIEDQNLEELKNGILYMIEHYHERKYMGENATLSVESYSTSIIARKWISLFDDIQK